MAYLRPMRSAVLGIRAAAVLTVLSVLSVLAVAPAPARAATLIGPLPAPLPLFPADNWWNLDITSAPVDPGSAAFITWIGPARGMHPDLGGDVSTGSVQNYGFSYAIVDRSQPKLAVQFLYSDESDGVDHATDTSFPFYPIPAECIDQAHWVEGGDPGSVDLRGSSDRHVLIVDEDERDLYELYNVWHDGVQWHAGSGAFFDLDANGRRPDGWTSADAAGLAILPGLIRYDEVFGPDPIRHAFRMTLRASNSYYVFPASHRAGSNASAPPFGARFRLRADTDLSGFPPECVKIFEAMKTYGLIFADNGSDMYVSGTYDNRWDNGVLNPCFRAITASDFDVVELGWNPPSSPAMLRDASIAPPLPPASALAGVLPLDPAADLYMPTVSNGDVDPEAVLADGGKPLVFYALTTPGVLRLSKAAGQTVRFAF